MKELYYQPEISEFHVGFEYEVLNEIGIDPNGFMGDPKESTIGEWYKFIFPDPYTGCNLEKLFLRKLRVKFLDVKDIESLGFEVFNKEIKGGAYPSEWYMLKHENDSLTQIHCQLSPYHFNKNNGIIINLSTRLKGNISILIKNKSELKKLLTQLNII